MTSWSNNLNGITSGTTVTTANSGGVSGTAFTTVTVPTGGSLTAQATAAQEGATGLQIVYSTTTTAGYVGWNATAAVGVRLAVSFWFQFASAPSATVGFYQTTPTAAALQLNSSRQILVNSNSGVVATSTAVTAGTWVFVQLASTVGSTTTSGRIEAKITTAAGATVLNYDSAATINTGTAAISSIAFGHPGFAAVANTFSYDLLTADNALGTGFPGTAAPTAGGNIKVWDGAAWVAKPVKVWTGTAWVAKPVKRWTGTAWVLTTY